MIEVIKVGRVVKFDKEKKIIAFIDPNRMKKKEFDYNWMSNPCSEIPLGVPKLMQQYND